VADGLASERDLAALKRAGIDPEEWVGLSSLIGKAISDPRPIELGNEVCGHLEISSMPIGLALRDPQPIDIASPVMGTVCPEAEIDSFVADDASLEKAETILSDEPEEILAQDNEIASQEEMAEEPVLEGEAVEQEVDESSKVDVEAEEAEEYAPVNEQLETISSESIESSDENESVMQVQPEEVDLSELEDSFSLQDVLSDPQPPNLVENIMQQLGIEGEDLTSDKSEQNEMEEESEEVYVLQFLDKSDITEEEVMSIETEMNIPIAEALSVSDVPNMLDSIMGEVEQIGVPQSHLRLVNHDDSFEQEAEDTSEVMGGVRVEIAEIESPVQIGDETISRGFLYASTFALSIAAAWLLYAFIQISPTDGQMEPMKGSAMAANMLEIERIESDEIVQIFQSDEQDPTIIFIEDSEGVE
jgi:hypothetical protein